MKALIVYYSLEGNTKLIANKIAEQTNADVLELVTKKECVSSGFGKYFFNGKSVLFKEKPLLEKYSVNIDDYELIIFGTPIWASTFAPPIRTFLNDHSNIKNKKIAVFACCSGGSANKCFNDIKKMLSDCTIVAKLTLIDPAKEDTEQQVNKAVEWAKEIVR